jgi:hypothetical protein
MSSIGSNTGIMSVEPLDPSVLDETIPGSYKHNHSAINDDQTNEVRVSHSSFGNKHDQSSEQLETT